MNADGTDRRVAVTGIGCVSAAGIGLPALADAASEGRSCIDEISLFDPEPYRCRHAAEIVDFEVDAFLESPKAYLDRHSELAFAAMRLAREDAGWNTAGAVPRSRTGLNFGTAYGCIETMGRCFDDLLSKGARFVKPVLFPHAYANTTSSLLAIEYGLDGHHLNFSAGGVSSALALVDAFDRIRTGRLDVAVVGGCEAFSEVLHAGLDGAGVLADTVAGPAGAWAPFDTRRSGCVPGEGAAVLILESLDHARERGARIRAEVCSGGIGVSFSAATLNELMRHTAAKTGGDGPDAILASANGSPTGDRDEAGAVRAFSRDAGRAIPVGSIKTCIGETFGASGVFQAAAGVSMLQDGCVWPATGVEAVEAGVELVRDKPRAMALRRVAVNVTDPGGTAVCLFLTKTDGE